MKSPKFQPFNSLLACCAVAAAMYASTAPAQIIAYDDASNYQLDANWTNNANQGFGYTPWVIVTNDTSPGPSQFHGTYVTAAPVSPAFANATFTNIAGVSYTNVWGIFANGTNGINATTAFRGFASPLGTNTFKLQWGAKGAGTTTVAGLVQHGLCGFSLRSGNETNTPADYANAARFFLFFEDGRNPGTLYVADGAGEHSLTGTSFSDLGRGNITNAVQAEVTPGADGSSYHLVLKDCVAGKILFAFDSVLAGSGTIDSAALFVQETTGDQVYNRMQISVPRVAPTIANVLPANNSLYVDPASTNFSFEVDSFGSTVASNDVTVLLNGVAQSNLGFDTAAPSSQLLVSLTPALSPNTLYTYTIIAQNAIGEAVTNTSSFNTFLPSNLFIDVYDYNYGSGQFVNASTPSNAYAGFLGTNGVDYSISDPTGTNNVAGYRPGDLPQILTLNTDASGDPIDHANLRANGYTAYNIGFNDAGNWENYTRVVPDATNYSIYARAAAVVNGVFEVARLVNPTATTTNQPLAPIGRGNVTPTGGSRLFSGQLTPLTDIFGNTVVLPLAGTNTLRTTSISGQGYNLEYLVLVPTASSGTLRPYIATANPAPNAGGISTLGKIQFTIANRQTTVTNVQLSLNGTNFSGSLVFTNGTPNAVGTSVFFNPTNLPASATNTLVVVVTDNTGTAQTNTWSFRTAALAGNGVWSGGASPDLNWSTALNWTGGVPGIGNNAIFASAGALTSPATNNIVAANTFIQLLGYSTNNNGFHTTLIADGVTLTITNATAGTTPALQVGGTGNNADNVFNKPVTNTITGSSGTLIIAGNPVGSLLANQLNFQIRQGSLVATPEMATLDMSGLGTLIATVGKVTVGQGGTGFAQTNVSGRFNLARTNVIALRRTVSGQLSVGDSSGGIYQLAASTLNLGVTNALFFDSAVVGNRKAIGATVRFNPIFTNSNASAFIRGTNGSNSRVASWNVGDVSIESTVPANAQGTLDFSGGSVNALVGTMILGEGSTVGADTGAAQGTLSLSAGTFDVSVLSNGVQRAVSTGTAAGVVNVNGTATLIGGNIVLAQAASGGNPALVSGTLNVTNGTVRANIVAGGGVSTINLVGGKLFAANTVGSSAAPVTTLNLSSASLHFRADGNSTVTNIVATTVTTSGTTVITIDSVSNVVSTVTNRLLGYTGASPFANLSLAPLPGGYAGSLVDSGGTIDLIVDVSAIPPSPSISKITYSSGQIIISGTNNAGAGGTYSLLSSTNLTTPLTNWTVLSSGSFDGSGNLLSTNANTNTMRFFILRVP